MNGISVIIPCYNSSNTIIRTLESLNNQIYKKNEVIIINDGSTDNTEKEIFNFINSSSLNIRYYSQRNQGVSATRNKGISLANYDLIMFLDSDDIYHPQMMKILIDKVKSSKSDTAFCYFTRKINENFAEGFLEDNIDYEVMNQNECMKELLYNKGEIAFTNFIYKKSILINNNITFPVNRVTGEDLEFIWKYLCHCNKIVNIKKELYGYYYSVDSATNKVFWERTESINTFFEIELYMKSQKVDFVETYSKYIYSRVIWSYAKTFSKGNRRDLFNKLAIKFNVKSHMKNMIFNSKNLGVSITALLYCISPTLFFIAIRTLYTIKDEI